MKNKVKIATIYWKQDEGETIIEKDLLELDEVAIIDACQDIIFDFETLKQQTSSKFFKKKKVVVK